MLKRMLDFDDPDQPLLPAFLEAINHGHPQKLQEVLEEGFPVNYQNPLTGETALHRLASGGARPALRYLTAREDVDYLARDNRGRLASELAYVFGRDPALARLLGNKERKQAAAQGIKLTRRPAQPS